MSENIDERNLSDLALFEMDQESQIHEQTFGDKLADNALFEPLGMEHVEKTPKEPAEPLSKEDLEAMALLSSVPDKPAENDGSEDPAGAALFQ